MKQKGQKKKRIKRNEDNLRHLWDNVKCPDVRIRGVPEEEDKRKARRKHLGGQELKTSLKWGRI